MPEYTVLLYYKYFPLMDPEKLLEEQMQICQDLNLKGRIILAKEGINGTVEGKTEDTEKYCEILRSVPGLEDISFKKSSGNGESFPKLSIKVREELVSGHLGVDPTKQTGKYLTPEELHQWFVEGKEFYIIDMRNNYEHLSGFFENSILPQDFHNFRDLPKILPQLEHLKGKTVVPVCTGGVRCETASGFLLKNGFADVYQLHGGIVSYMEKYPNQHFKGKLYVFDQRMLVGFNTDSPEHEVVGRCKFCDVKSENYINVRAATKEKPRIHIICCENCIAKGLAVPD